MHFPVGSDGKESACNVGEPGSTPGSGRSPGEGNGNPLQYSCLDNSIDRGAWGCNSPWGCKEPDTAEWLTLSLFLLKICHFDFYEYAFLKSNASKWIRFKMFFFSYSTIYLRSFIMSIIEDEKQCNLFGCSLCTMY